jgi:signal transduction histidine kinase/CheY-like chemotaxis protein
VTIYREANMEVPIPKLPCLAVVWFFIALTAGVGLAQNHVLQLDRKGDYVQLPDNAFSNLDEATVESWVKWDQFGYLSQPWGFGSGRTFNAICLTNQGYSNSLQFYVYEKKRLHRIMAANVLSRSEWCHLAAVSGRGGMHLCLNGVLIGQNQLQGSLSAILPGEGNYIGKSHWHASAYFHAQMDEIRVWDIARTADQINASMFEHLTGKEAHMVGLWNFESGDAVDAAGHGYDGILKGNSQRMQADLPPASEPARPWYLNTRIAVPSAAGFIGLLGAVIALSNRLVANRRKAQQLQARLLENERQRNVLLEKARDAAETANRAKSVFLANMSHDIRTPLNAILGYAQVLLRKNDLSAETRRAVTTIAECGHHLLSLINDILDISRIEAGRLELTPTDFDLVHFIEGFSAAFRPRCEQKGLTWRVEWEGFSQNGNSDGPLTEGQVDESVGRSVRLIVHADEGKLRQILINLLSNAVKFTDTGEIVLRIGEMARYAPLPQAGRSAALSLTFEVIDTGVGIPLDAQEHIFEAFTQTDGGQGRGGTGLGLAIAKQYVELMGGSIGVESAPGKGSRFFLSLPLEAAKEVAGSHFPDGPFGRRSRITRLANGRQVHALVVDDVWENQDVLAQLLRDVGATVNTAANGRQALESLQASHYDVVFMDIRMPDMDGLTASREILRTSATERPRLVAVSASALLSQRQEYLQAGFEEFLAKPIDAERLYAVLARLLHVRFEYGPPETVAAGSAPEQSWGLLTEYRAGFETVSLPDELLCRLRAAMEAYNATELTRCLEKIEQLGQNGRKLAEHLRNWIECSELDQVRRILEQIEARQS